MLFRIKVSVSDHDPPFILFCLKKPFDQWVTQILQIYFRSHWWRVVYYFPFYLNYMQSFFLISNPFHSKASITIQSWELSRRIRWEKGHDITDNFPCQKHHLKIDRSESSGSFILSSFRTFCFRLCQPINILLILSDEIHHLQQLLSYRPIESFWLVISTFVHHIPLQPHFPLTSNLFFRSENWSSFEHWSHPICHLFSIRVTSPNFPLMTLLVIK